LIGGVFSLLAIGIGALGARRPHAGQPSAARAGSSAAAPP
jgi:hypothetical protein